MKNKHIKREGLKKQYLEAKICNVIDYLSFLTLQTGDITSQSLSDLNLPLKKYKKKESEQRLAT
jgi:hypothetical protein